MMMPTNLAKKRKGDFPERFPPPPVFKRPDNASSSSLFQFVRAGQGRKQSLSVRACGTRSRVSLIFIFQCFP